MWRSLPHHLVRGLPMSTPRSRAAGDTIANQRMGAVSADHEIGLGRAPVRKGERHAPAVFRNANELLTVHDGVSRHDVGERRMQVAAMQCEIRRAVTFLHRATQRIVVSHLAADGVAVKRRGGRKAHVAQPGLDAQSAMHLHGVWALLDAGADPREGLGLLVDDRIDAGLPQRRRNGEPADAGADDRDRGVLAQAHHCLFAVF
jgi:hypothetical protein